MATRIGDAGAIVQPPGAVQVSPPAAEEPLPGMAEVCLAAFRRLQSRPFGVAPLVSSNAVALKDTEEVLLRAGYAA